MIMNNDSNMILDFFKIQFVHIMKLTFSSMKINWEKNGRISLLIILVDLKLLSKCYSSSQFLLPIKPHHHPSLRAERPDSSPPPFPFPLPHPAHRHCLPPPSQLYPAIVCPQCAVHWAPRQLTLYELFYSDYI